MVSLSWGNTGQRFFETGIDRGVLYLNGTGVVWNGLVSVSENPSGGTSNPYYMNGLQYLNRPTLEEYEASVESFGYPDELNSCVGKRSIRGLVIDQQPKKSFGFSYRTKLGNDVDGVSHGYKIHLVYNARASSPEVQNDTLSDSPELVKYGWDVTAVPQRVTGYMPTAHFVIDSTRTNPALLALIEGYLYGSDGVEPRLVTPEQLKALFETWSTVSYSKTSNFLGIASNSKTLIRNLATNSTMASVGMNTTVRTNLCVNPSFETGTSYFGKPSTVTLNTSTFASAIVSGAQALLIAIGAGASTFTYVYNDIDITASQWVAWKANFRWSAGSRYFRQELRFINAGGTYTTGQVNGPVTMGINNATGGSRYLISAQAPDDAVKARLMVTFYNDAAGTVAPVDASQWQSEAWHAAMGRTQADAEWRVHTYFDGSTPASADFTYVWSGAEHASTSSELGLIPTTAGIASGSNGAASVYRTSTDVPDGSTYAAKMIWTQGSTAGSNGVTFSPTVSGSAGDVITAKFLVKLDVSRTVQFLVRPRNGVTQVAVDNTVQVVIQPNTWTEMTATVTATGDYTNIVIWPWFRSPSTANAGNFIVIAKPLITINGEEVPYFHGDSTDTVYRNQHVDPAWVGTPNLSFSEFAYYPSLLEAAAEGDMMLTDGNIWAVDNGVWENLGPLATALE